MACVDDDTILSYFRGELGVDEVTAIEHELDSCESCRELMMVVASEWRNNDGVLGDERRPGTTVGRYVIDQVLGAGAMGVVYRARDPELARSIALKVMARPTPKLAERFRREAQAMARLSHRNVVQVFDVGGTGIEAFVAMEQIRGFTLRAWMREPRALRAILDVFAQAADGLAAAHDAGITHRDFKPENVLVGDDGVVRVGDFGLAQLLASDDDGPELATGSPAGPTVTVGAGTPAYLAPEVRAGGAAGARADQYSFWVALHEAVVGARPDAGPAKIAPRRLARAIARGLATDPAERFGSLHVVAAELRAIADHAGHVRRRLAIAVPGLVLVAGVAWFASDRAPSPCATAGSELAAVWSPVRAAQVRAALASASQPYAASAAEAVSTRLASYAETWRRSALGACKATHVDRTQSAELLDRRSGCLAERRAELAAVVDRLSDRALVRDSVAMVDALSSIAVCDDVATLTAEPVPPHDPEAVAALAAVRALIASAKAHFHAGTFDEGVVVARTAVDAARRTHHRPVLAEALETYGGLTTSAGKPEDAIAIFDEGLREAEASRSVRAALAIRLREAEVFGALGKSDEALRAARLGLATAEGLGFAVTAGDFEVEIGVLESDLKHDDIALAAYQKALPIYERELGKDAANTGHLVGLIGMVLDDLGRHDEGTKNLERALEIEGVVYGTAHPNYANSLSNLASHTFDVDRVAAIKLAERAHVIRLAALGPMHPELAMSWSNLGAMRRMVGQLAEAKSDLEHAIAIKEQVLPDSPSLGISLLNLSQVEMDLHELDSSVQHAERAVALLGKALGNVHPYTATAQAQLGAALLERGRPADAIAPLEAAVARLADDSSHYTYQFNLADALAKTGGAPARIHALATAALAGATQAKSAPAIQTIATFLKNH